MTAVAVVLAGGSGQRAGLGRNKALAELAGRPMLRWSVDAFAELVDRVVVVARPADRAVIAELVADVPHVAGVVDGGATRHASERAGLAAVGDADVVLVHDAARPLVGRALIERVLTAARDGAAVVPALPRPVPLCGWPASVDGPVLDGARLVERAGLVGVQTPQAAPVEVLRAAFAAEAQAQTHGQRNLDTVEPVLAHLPDVPVLAVPGEERNRKVTWRSDVGSASRLLVDPEAIAAAPRLRVRSGTPTGGAPFAHLEVDGATPVTDALRRVEGNVVVGAVDRTHLVDLTGDLLAVPGTLREPVGDAGEALEEAVRDGATLRVRRRR